ncbi:hypothetical protein [Pseudomonas cremoricolorata]|uniref:hypothetical protein n=1 Tax=Pseudomonas cremoricolorata TaxID=157783 RepID=UPI00048E98AD|nr:hypothetical protein [Pseudomonas cremoricolorata]
MARPTLTQYLTYMKQQPRTYEWGALLVYDRYKTNRLLAQEYIARFQGGDWIKPVNVRKETETGSWTDVSDLTSGSPLLSFINSNIGGSAAKLSIPMLGGKIKTLRQRPGSSQIELTGLSTLDPLTAPRLDMNIKLDTESSGSISGEGRVVLDLSNGSGYSFVVSPWKDLNDKVGAAIRSEFEKRPLAERVWVINTLKPVEGELKPTSFTVRTHSLARAGVTLASEDPAELEEGAVLVGIAFNDETGGTFPTADKDLPYLLPETASSSPEAYSANIIIKHEHWVKNLLVKMIKSIPEFAGLTPEYEQQGRFVVQANFGHLAQTFDEVHRTGEGYFHWGKLLGTSLIADPALSRAHFRFADDTIAFEWRCTVPATVECEFEWSGMVIKGTRSYRSGFVLKKAYTLAVGATGSVVLQAGASQLEHSLSNDDTTDVRHIFQNFYTDQVLPVLETKIQGKFDSFTGAIEKAGPSIDVLRLNGLLFRSDNAVTPESVRAPGDLSLLGTLAPKLTAFAIEPLNPTIAASTRQAFELKPAPAGTPTWAVEHLPGGQGEKGSIEDGLYTPPTSAQISGTSLRVLISAKVGDKVAYSLVTVVPKSIAVFPFLQTVNFATVPSNPPRHVLVGGALDAALQWRTTDGFKGKIRPAEPYGRDADLSIPQGMDVRVYEAPVHSPGAPGTAGMMIQRDRVEVTGHGATAGIDLLVPWQSPTATIKVVKQGAGLKLSLWVASWTGGEVEVPVANTMWFTIVGSKAVDPATGVYPPGDTGDYTVLAAADKTSNVLTWGYISLPLPYDLNYEQLLKYVQLRSTVRY